MTSYDAGPSPAIGREGKRMAAYNGVFALPEPAMSLAISKVPTPVNEPVRGYAPGSPERASLQAKLAEMAATQTEMPLVIDGKDVRTGKLGRAEMPHRHAHVLGEFHQGGAAEVQSRIDADLRAQM